MTSEVVRRIAEGRNANLPPTPRLSADQFEDFVERLLSAHRFCPDSVVHVARVERWGRKGDRQDGIDFEGAMTNGRSVAWQCKRQDALTAANVREYVADCTFVADRLVLAFSGEASSAARAEIDKFAGWELLDQRGLGRLLDDLPLSKRRDVLDATWGAVFRRQFLDVPGEDAFLSIESFLKNRLIESQLLNDRGTLIGRDAERHVLSALFDRDGDWPPVVVVAGPGGRGKSRLLAATLSEFQSSNPRIPVLVLAQGRSVDVAALSELPHGPAVLLIDDVHRDPDQLLPLLDYQKQTEGTQLVLGSRGQGIEPIKNTLFRAGLSTAQVELVSLEDIDIKDARRLVADLAIGMDLPYGLIEHLAAQAVDAPYVAVVALNLARRGELLPGFLRLDAGLRSQILARYEEILVAPPAGFAVSVVRKFIATLAALGTADLGEPDVQGRISGFLGIERIALLRLVEGLAAQGVVVRSERGSRIVPEVLADQVLEDEAVAFSVDTGFVADLWNAFERDSEWRLLTNLASLEWRLTSRGLPSVIGSIWDAIKVFVEGASLRALQSFLAASQPLAVTQPKMLMVTLGWVRQRLDILLLSPSELVDGDPFETLWGGRPLSVQDVEWQLPKLYVACAQHESSLLETALDGIWEIAKLDDRPTNQHPDHAVRVALDLANVGELKDASFPARIIARVRTWLGVNDLQGQQVTPLFLLAPLLVKEGFRTVQTDRRTLTFSPYFIRAEWARPYRDDIRILLSDQGASSDIRRAAQAVKLLTSNLRRPHGQFGLEVDNATVDSWEADDLETVMVLESIAIRTESSVVRRLLRQQVEWAAQHGGDGIRSAALELVYRLDQRSEDDLAEVLLPSSFHSVQRQRGLAKAVLAPDSIKKDRWEVAANKRRELALEVCDTLWGAAVSDTSLGMVVETLHDVRSARQDDSNGLGGLFAAVIAGRPQYISDLVQLIEASRRNALDSCLHILLAGWLDADRVEMMAFLVSFADKREGVRRAVGQMFARHTLIMSADLEAVRRLGIEDPLPDIRQEFLSSLGAQLVTDPIVTAELLLQRAVSEQSVGTLLNEAWRIDERWAAGRSLSEVTAILGLVLSGAWEEWISQQTLIPIVQEHLALCLSALCDRSDLDVSMHSCDQEVVDAVRAQPSVFAQWILRELEERRDPVRVASVVEAVTADVIDEALGEEIAARIAGLGAPELTDLLDVLGATQSWAIRSPRLAMEVLLGSRAHGSEPAEEIPSRLLAAMHPGHWGFSNGHSDELNRSLTLCESAIGNAGDEELKAMYIEAAGWHRARIEDAQRDYEDDED